MKFVQWPLDDYLSADWFKPFPQKNPGSAFFPTRIGLARARMLIEKKCHDPGYLSLPMNALVNCAAITSTVLTANN